MDEHIARLSKLFASLGAANPARWATSQVNEGIPQLARYLFLRQAWRLVVSESDDSWIEARVREYRRDPEAPYAGVGRAIEKLRIQGANAEVLTDLVRGMQADLLFGLCYLLEDPGDTEEEVSDVVWGLFLLDEYNRPVELLNGLHESILETDPTGREMKPRKLPG